MSRYDNLLEKRNNEHTVTHIKGHFQIYFTRKQNEKLFNCLDERLKRILARYQIRHSVDNNDNDDDDDDDGSIAIDSFIHRLFSFL